MHVQRPTARTSVVAVALTALAAPCLLAVMWRHLFAVGDIALIELRTRDVLSAHPPLVGAYSRYGWSHPGPLEFYLFALPYRLLGASFAALRVTALFFNVAVLITTIWVVRQRGAAALAMVLCATTGLVWGSSPNALADSWNVTIAVLPFMLTIVACWCAWCGDRWAWLVAAAAFSFVFQAHIGFGVVLAPVVVTTVARLVIRARDDRHEQSLLGVALGAAAGVALGLPVLFDVIANWPGNLERLIRWSIDNDEPTIGLSQGVRLLGRASSLSFPAHARFPNQFVFSIGTVDVGVLPGALLVLLVLVLVIAARREMAAEAQLCGCLLITWCAGLVAASRVTEPLAFWLVEWLQPLAWLTWGAVVLVGWRLVQPFIADRFGRAEARRVCTGAALGALVIGTVASARGSAHADRHDTTAAPIEAFVAAARHLDRSQPIYIDYDGDAFSVGTIFLAVANELDRAGLTVCVDAAFENQFGASRTCPGRSDVRLLMRDEPTVMEPPEGATTLAISDPLSSAERTEADALTASLTEVLLQNDLSDDEPLLHTAFAALILDHLPPDVAASNRPGALRLAGLRAKPGTRLALYEVAS